MKDPSAALARKRKGREKVEGGKWRKIIYLELTPTQRQTDFLYGTCIAV